MLLLLTKGEFLWSLPPQKYGNEFYLQQAHGVAAKGFPEFEINVVACRHFQTLMGYPKELRYEETFWQTLLITGSLLKTNLKQL